MTAIAAYLAARAAYVVHDALAEGMVDGLTAELSDHLGDWRRVRFSHTHPPGGFPTGTTYRVIDAHDWPLGQESAEVIDATLAAWHRLLIEAWQMWDRLSEVEQRRSDPPPESTGPYGL